MSEEIEVPATKMESRYRKLKTERSTGEQPKKLAHQVLLATETAANTDGLASDFAASVAAFERYEPPIEPFHDFSRPDDSLDGQREKLRESFEDPEKDETRASGHQLAARLIDAESKSSGGLPRVSYLDREIPPGRTQTPFRYETNETKGLELDLLFSANGQPVIAEVKAKTDEGAYSALIQALASCAELASDVQRKRLAKHSLFSIKALRQKREGSPSQSLPDPVALNESGKLECWIILLFHNENSAERTTLANVTGEIAQKLMDHPGVNEVISAIRCVDASIPQEGPVVFTERWKAIGLGTTA